MDTTTPATTETWAKCEESVVPERFMNETGGRRERLAVSSVGSPAYFARRKKGQTLMSVIDWPQRIGKG